MERLCLCQVPGGCIVGRGRVRVSLVSQVLSPVYHSATLPLCHSAILINSVLGGENVSRRRKPWPSGWRMEDGPTPKWMANSTPSRKQRAKFEASYSVHTAQYPKGGVCAAPPTPPFPSRLAQLGWSWPVPSGPWRWRWALAKAMAWCCLSAGALHGTLHVWCVQVAWPLPGPLGPLFVDCQDQ